MNEVELQMAVARYSENIELQEGDPNYENETTITARRTEAEGLYESLDLQKIDNSVYEDLPTKKEKDLQKLLQSVRKFSRIVAVCLGMLCLLLLGVNIGQAVHYHSPSNSMTHDDNNMDNKTNYDNLMQEKNRLQTNYNNLMQEKNRLQTNYDTLEQENTRLKTKAINDTSCPSGWKKFGCSCYYKSTEKETWQESRAQCLQTGADLVIINSQEEQDFVKRLIHGDGYYSWIGLKRSGGRWIWVDGTPLTTTQYWFGGYPTNDEDRNCAWYWSGAWFNALCSSRIYHICEK